MRIVVMVIDDQNSVSIGVKAGGEHDYAGRLTKDEALGSIAGLLYGNPHSWFYNPKSERPVQEWLVRSRAQDALAIRAHFTDWPLPSWYREGDELIGLPAEEVAP